MKISLLNNAMSKYHSKKTPVDGIIFDSKAEADRFVELKLLQRSGAISGLILQPSFDLIPAYKKNGKKVRKTVYVADFQYYDEITQETVIEDVKGVKTPVYKLKKKLFEYLYPDLEITEVT